MKNTIFLVLLTALLHHGLAAQKIKYTYDAAGNRTVRELVPMFSGAGTERGAGDEEAAQPAAPALSEGQVKVWPNPVSYQLNVEVQPSAEEAAAQPSAMVAEVFDLSGRMVQRQQLSGSRAAVPMEGLPAGTYILFVRKGRSYLKWVVEKV